MTAAQVIKAASDIYRINPKVLLVMLQKEQSLITGSNCSNLDTALGYGCPDTADCDNAAKGFTRQIDYGAYHLRGYFDDTLNSVPYGVGNNTVYYHPGPWNNAEQKWYGRFGNKRDIEYCGSSVLNIRNRATAALYSYTPYQPNAAALAAGYGSAEPCGSYGNRNFYHFFSDWFGNPTIIVQGAIATRYNQLGGVSGSLGRPVNNEYTPNNQVWWQQFENGFIIGTGATGFWESKGGVRERWGQLGYQNGVLGYPTGPENYDGRGWWQSYQNGSIIGTIATGFWESKGSTRERWGQLGYQTGTMGYPTGALITSSDSNAAWQSYQNGYIVWNTATGAWESKGAIRERWGQLGYQTGTMGYPTGAEVSDGKAWWQPYQSGFIIGSSSTGFWESKGAIRERWGQLGYQNGSMGLPIGTITTSADGKSAWQPYKNGFIVWSLTTGAWESKGALRDYWARLGYQSGKAGFPTGPELYNGSSKTWSQTYQHGTIYYNTNNGGWYAAN